MCADVCKGMHMCVCVGRLWCVCVCVEGSIDNPSHSSASLFVYRPSSKSLALSAKLI